ncbi:MAG: ZIP family metal transporter [Fidelibacterota bacterium]
MEYGFLIQSFVAGLLASVACGLGALPLLYPGLEIRKRVGLGYGFAGGLMIAASVYNLILPGLTLGEERGEVDQVLAVLGGLLLGAGFLWGVDRILTPERMQGPFLRKMGTKKELLIFTAMSFHSIPEGVAVGVGYATSQHVAGVEHLGSYIAVAIAIHNIPEGLAVSIPMRANGASIPRCFTAAFLTSLPQPLAAVPAALLVWLFEPLMIPFLGFAAGAMMYLVILQVIPDALEKRLPVEISWAFILGFSLMVLVQVVL